jgi:hypothetical protein
MARSSADQDPLNFVSLPGAESANQARHADGDIGLDIVAKPSHEDDTGNASCDDDEPRTEVL